MVSYELKPIKLQTFMCFDCVSAAYHYDTLILKTMWKSEGILHTGQTLELLSSLGLQQSDRPVLVKQDVRLSTTLRQTHGDELCFPL